MIIPFDQEAPLEMVGCKGHNLSRMWQAGLPVPAGFCVTWDGIESLDSTELDRALTPLGTEAFAVRSSAIQEDSAFASFAGILLSRLNVTTAAGVLSVLTEIRNAAVAPATTGYSRRRDVQSAVRVAGIVQVFISAEASGVLFMRDPLTGAGHIVVEAAWGLGVGVVEGLVRPDRWVISTDGTVTSSHIADKDIAIIPNESGGTKEFPVDPSCRRRACLTAESLRQLSGLAAECQHLFGSPQDIEWAVSDNRVWLLQSRPITSTRL
jgi:pyruvate,water dikinase